MPNPAVAISFATDTVVVAVSGDLAFERGTYRFTTTRADGQSEDTGNYLTVWKKVGQTCRLAADMAASDWPLSG